MHWKTIAEIYLIAIVLLMILSATTYHFLPRGGSTEMLLPRAGLVSSWSLSGPGFLRLSTVQVVDSSPSIEFGTNFSSANQKVSATLSFASPLSLMGEEYLLLWIYATPDLSSNLARSFGESTPFHFALTLTSADGSNKTFGNYPIGWQGWARFALPLDYRGLLVGGDVTHPAYAGVSVTSTWNDSLSVQRITQLRLDFFYDSALQKDGIHSILVSDLRFSAHQFGLAEELNALISALAIYSIAIIGSVYLLKHRFPASRSRPLQRIKSFFNLNLTSTQVRVFWLLVSAKILLTTATPLSSDFIDTVWASLPLEPGLSPLTNTPLVGGYAASLSHLMYQFWLILPVDHLEPLQIFPGNRFIPSPGTGIFHFPVTPGSLLLVLLLKMPLTLADIILSVVIFNIVQQLTNSPRPSATAALLWLANPFNTLIIEMWSNFDTIFLLLLTLSVYLLIQRRNLPSAALFGLAVGVRVWAVTLLPFFLSTLKAREAATPGDKLLNRERIGYVLIATISLTLSILPFVLSNLARDRTPQLSIPGAPDITFFLGLNFSIENYTIFVVLSSLILFLYLLFDWWKPTPAALPSVLLIFFLILFAGSHWLPQWLLWISPFLTIDYAVRRSQRKYPLSLMLIIVPLVVFLHSYYFASWGNSFFFLPNINQAINSLSYTLFFLPNVKVPLGLQGLEPAALLESTFVGICLAYLLSLYRTIKEGVHG